MAVKLQSHNSEITTGNIVVRFSGFLIYPMAVF